MTQPFDYKLDQLFISDSTIKLFHSCAAKFEYKKMFRHGLKERSIDMAVGNALHIAYQDYLVYRDEDRACLQLLFNYPFDLCSDESSHPKHIFACYSVLEAMFSSQNLTEYDLVYIKNKAGETIPATEVPFILEMKNIFLDADQKIKIFYRGKIDAILRSRLSGKYMCVDVKTHRNNVDDLTYKYMYDEQPIPYGIVLQQLIGEDVNNFDISFISCYIDLVNPKVQPYTFNKNTYEINSWARGLRIDIELMKMYYQLQWFRRDASSCMAFKTKCQFVDSCHIEDRYVKQKLVTIEQDENKLYHDKDEDYFGQPLVEMELELDV